MEIVIVAFIMDLLIGDPRWLPHPIRMIGQLISFLEGIIRNRVSGKTGQICGGAIIVVLTLATVYLLSLLLIHVLSPFKRHILAGNIDLYVVFAGVIGSFSLALRSLITEVNDIVKELEDENLYRARKKLSYIVGRDTKYLSRDGMIRALIETISENASDGVIAPLFYFAIGGLPLAFTYKAINTLDSMLGYKSERYRYLGLVAAKLDDIANYIPARITAVVLMCSTVILMPFYGRLDFIRALRVLLRDAKKHPSPNAGFPEATVAGALGIVLLGPAFYDGVLHNKPFIGEGYREPEIKDINITTYMVCIAVFLTLTIFLFLDRVV
jgi:adenosylcobinamide-phosphate synthase